MALTGESVAGFPVWVQCCLLTPLGQAVSVFFLGTMGGNDYVVWVQPGPCHLGGDTRAPGRHT